MFVPKMFIRLLMVAMPVVVMVVMVVDTEVATEVVQPTKHK